MGKCHNDPDIFSIYYKALNCIAMNHWEILSLLRNLALNVDANYSNIFCTFISGPDSEINVIHLVSKIKNALHFPYVCPTNFFLFCNCLTLSRFKINQGQGNGLPHWLALLRIIESVCKLMLSSWSLPYCDVGETLWSLWSHSVIVLFINETDWVLSSDIFALYL